MLKLREIEPADIDLLFEWANDPLTRKNSFHSDMIQYEDHKKWFSRMISDDSVLQYIMMEDEIPVGQIRLNLEAEKAEIGYSIAAEYRGRGYGHIILQLIKGEIRNKHPEIRKLVARVKPDNIASNRLFISEGYTPDFTEYSYELSV